jgi:hypothetical protein
MSALSPKADMFSVELDVCFVPETDIGWGDGQLIAADDAPRKCCNVANATASIRATIHNSHTASLEMVLSNSKAKERDPPLLSRGASTPMGQFRC